MTRAGESPGAQDWRRAGALASIGTTLVACTVVGLSRRMVSQDVKASRGLNARSSGTRS